MVISSRSTLLAGAAALGLTLSLGLAPGALAGASARKGATPIKVIQNSSEEIDRGSRCGEDDPHDDSDWFRRFDLSGMHAAEKGFRVSQVVVGVYKAISADKNLPGTITVSAIDKADPLTLANLEHIATVPVNYDTVPDESLLTVPVAAAVPAGKDMVLQATVIEGTSGESFFLGANASRETAEDYFRATACGYSQPTPVSELGPQVMNHVIYAVGKSTECIEAEPGLIAAQDDLASAEKKLKKAKKKLDEATEKLQEAKKNGNSEAIERWTDKKKKAAKDFKEAKKDKRKAAAAVAKAGAECAQPPLPAPR